MTTVRFATTCDICSARSVEYSTWPSCRDCHRDVCPVHWAAGTKIDADVDQPETVICRECYKEYAMQTYEVSFYGRNRNGPRTPARFYIRTRIVATGLGDCRQQLHERYRDVQDVKVLNVLQGEHSAPQMN